MSPGSHFCHLPCANDVGSALLRSTLEILNPALFRNRLDNLAYDGVVNPHSILLTVTDKSLRNLAVNPISECINCWHVTTSPLSAAAILRKALPQRTGVVCPQRLNPTFNSRNLALLLPVHRSSLGGLTTTILLIVAHCRLSRTAYITIRGNLPLYRALVASPRPNTIPSSERKS